MRVLAISWSIATVILLLGPTSASAVAPVREPDLPTDTTFLAGDVCSFPIRVLTISDHGSITTFPDGHLLFTGRFVARITDLATDGSIDVNFSGPFVVRFEADGTATLVAHGPFVWILFEGDIGGPGLLYTTGLVTATANQDFFLTAFDLSGRSTDLCPIVGAA